MKVIKPYTEFITPIDGDVILRRIEKCGRTCYSEDTEILTNTGFKFIKEIDEKDLVLTYSKEKNRLEYVPSNIIKYYYKGDMVCSKHLNIKFCVTPDHRMFMASGKSRNYAFMEASCLIDGNKNKKNFRIPKYFLNATIHNKDFESILTFEKEINHGARPSTIEKLSIKINDDWLVLLGAYITEGHSYHGEKYGNGSYIQITQSENNELYNKVISALDNLNISYRINEDSRKPYIKWIQFGNQLYVKIFEDLCGQYSKNKHLPIWFRELSTRQIQILLKILYLGDGSHNKTRNEKYLSISKQLLEEVQELWILNGRNATMNYNSNISQRCYTEENLRDSWILNREKHIYTKPYEGMVYCPSTENGIVCVRYNNKTFWCGNCYKSENMITTDSARKFIKNIIKRGHESVLEHCGFSVKFVCDRGVSHELVRHRIASFSQESTRYCNYSKDKFGSELTFIKPCFFKTTDKNYDTWYKLCQTAERAYFSLLNNGAKPEEARSVLPNSLKTEIIITANLREWRTFFKLRCDGAAHPQMRELTCPLLKECQQRIPIIFDDITATPFL